MSRSAGLLASGGAGRVDPRLRARLGEVRGWLALAVIFGLGQTGCLVVQALLLGDLVARAVRGPLQSGRFVPDLVALAGVSVLRGVLGALGPLWATRGAQVVRGRLRRDGLVAALGLGSRWLAGERTGELAVQLGPGLDALDTYVSAALPRVVLAVLSPVVLLGVIGWLNWLSLVTLLVVLAIVPVFLALVGRLTAARVRRRSAALGRLGAHFLDVLQGLATLRAFGRARRQEGELAKVSEELRRATLGVLREAFLSGLVLETMAAVGTALVAVPLGLELLAGRTLLAPALAVLVMTPEVFSPIRRASADFHAASEGLEAAHRVLDVVASAPGGGAIPRGSGTGRGPAAPIPGAGPPGLVVRDAVLVHPGRDRPVLEGASLTVAPGERVALIGPSGAGKSSLLEAILGLAPLASGEILLGGQVQGTVPQDAWCRRIAYLPQRPRLFAGSIRENLLLGAPEGSGSTEDLIAAVRVAQLEDLLARLPGGWEAGIGEDGGRLSAGERQRVALARALVRRWADVVVLDEPTAHLDQGTEARVVQALDAWLGPRAVVVVTHRPQVLALATRVLVLDEGRLVPAAWSPGQLPWVSRPARPPAGALAPLAETGGSGG